VVELDVYFEPSFKIIEQNHSFSAADVGGPFGKVHTQLAFDAEAMIDAHTQDENSYRAVERCLLKMCLKNGKS